jgi:16S rRNA (uracil1498-N3)-methyltransferase
LPAKSFNLNSQLAVKKLGGRRTVATIKGSPLMSSRYFMESPPRDERAVLTGSEAHHLLHVMRARVGDEVVLFDGSGWEFEARIERLGRTEVECAITQRQQIDRELARPITLGVALPKGDRQQWLVEKAVELGVAKLIPLRTTRGVAQPNENALQRLHRTVIEASKQCGRNRLMEIAPPQTWNDFVAAPSDAELRLLAHPGGEQLDRLADRTSAARSFRLAIGPEGGLTEDEAQRGEAAGWHVVDLGARIVRIETACLLLAGWASLAAPDQ